MLGGRQAVCAQHEQMPDLVATDPCGHRPPRRVRTGDAIGSGPIERVPEREQQIVGQRDRGRGAGCRVHGHHCGREGVGPQQGVGEVGVVLVVFKLVLTLGS